MFWVLSEMHVAMRGLAGGVDGSCSGTRALNGGWTLTYLHQYHMITKKLTFYILIKSSRKKFPNYVLGTKSVSDIENGISIAIFYAIREKLGPKTYLDAQYKASSLCLEP